MSEASSGYGGDPHEPQSETSSQRLLVTLFKASGDEYLSKAKSGPGLVKMTPGLYKTYVASIQSHTSDAELKQALQFSLDLWLRFFNSSVSKDIDDTHNLCISLVKCWREIVNTLNINPMDLFKSTELNKRPREEDPDLPQPKVKRNKPLHADKELLIGNFEEFKKFFDQLMTVEYEAAKSRLLPKLEQLNLGLTVPSNLGQALGVPGNILAGLVSKLDLKDSLTVGPPIDETDSLGINLLRDTKVYLDEKNPSTPKIKGAVTSIFEAIGSLIKLEGDPKWRTASVGKQFAYSCWAVLAQQRFEAVQEKYLYSFCIFGTEAEKAFNAELVFLKAKGYEFLAPLIKETIRELVSKLTDANLGRVIEITRPLFLSDAAIIEQLYPVVRKERLTKDGRRKRVDKKQLSKADKHEVNCRVKPNVLFPENGVTSDERRAIRDINVWVNDSKSLASLYMPKTLLVTHLIRYAKRIVETVRQLVNSYQDLIKRRREDAFLIIKNGRGSDDPSVPQSIRTSKPDVREIPRALWSAAYPLCTGYGSIVKVDPQRKFEEFYRTPTKKIPDLTYSEERSVVVSTDSSVDTLMSGTS